MLIGTLYGCTMLSLFDNDFTPFVMRLQVVDWTYVRKSFVMVIFHHHIDACGLCGRIKLSTLPAH